MVALKIFEELDSKKRVKVLSSGEVFRGGDDDSGTDEDVLRWVDSKNLSCNAGMLLCEAVAPLILGELEVEDEAMVSLHQDGN